MSILAGIFGVVLLVLVIADLVIAVLQYQLTAYSFRSVFTVRRVATNAIATLLAAAAIGL